MVERWAIERKRARALGGFSVEKLRGVEIGPLDRPLIGRSESEVYYVDHVSAEELRIKYAGDDAVIIDEIPAVDFVWKDRTLVEMIGDKAPLDYIVAAHVIEHVPDLIGWLKEMHSALCVGGKLVLVVPDKRFTFDFFRRTSSFEEVQQAHKELRRRPGLRCIMDHFSNVVAADTWSLWEDYSKADDLKFYHSTEFLSLAQKDFDAGKYIDVHCWVFSPWSFMTLIGQIVETEELPFDLGYFLTTQSHDLEFYVQLDRVESSRTNYRRAAEEALQGALWPNTWPRVTPVMPSSGTVKAPDGHLANPDPELLTSPKSRLKRIFFKR